MPAYRKVGYAEYKETSGAHATDSDTREGIVTVYYRRGGFDEFKGVSRKAFFEWQSAGWNLNYLPRGIRLRIDSD
jgi:hypothetical protein